MTAADRQPAKISARGSLLRWGSVVSAGVFALSAAVQLNDPDWVVWFLFYVAATALTVAAPRIPQGRSLAALWLAGTLAWGALIVSYGLEPITPAEFFGDLRMKTLNVERWRELGGLVITGAWMAVLLVALPRPGRGAS